ncbi:MAG TPA: histidine kinase [Polyangiaceae bacterium LLY-WYZ-14_1]|nr:histidine kinase [Polyangiaceae bacterium LLY-WYZ-14_1]
MASFRPMSPVVVVIELAEKMALLAAAALVAVLFPPLRNRILGIGTRRDKLAGLLLGLGLAIWGSMLSLELFGTQMNVRAIGVIIAALLGGRKSGALAGLVGGAYSAYRGEETSVAIWVVTASVTDGVVAGLVAKRWPLLFVGWRAFVTSVAIQGFHMVIVGGGLFLAGDLARHLHAWPAHLIKMFVNAAGVTLFVVVARLVVAREHAGVALGEARAAADAAALEALRRRLEPHFLFNALTALRAVIRRDPVKARELVSDLADLYRYLLSHPEDATLRDETAHAQAFLAVERVRLGEERLTTRIDLDPAVAEIRVPALMLQPLVENAVRHGVTPYRGPGCVEVTATSAPGAPGEADQVVVEVVDRHSGPRVGGHREKGTGVALDTLRQRLRRRYGDRASLRLSPTGWGMRATLRIPAALEEVDDPAQVRHRTTIGETGVGASESPPGVLAPDAPRSVGPGASATATTPPSLRVDPTGEAAS